VLRHRHQKVREGSRKWFRPAGPISYTELALAQIVDEKIRPALATYAANIRSKTYRFDALIEAPFAGSPATTQFASGVGH